MIFCSLDKNVIQVCQEQTANAIVKPRKWTLAQLFTPQSSRKYTHLFCKSSIRAASFDVIHI